jgi:hypothetical protein
MLCLAEEIKTINMHGLVPRNLDDFTYGRTTTNVGILGMHVMERGAVFNGHWDIVIGEMSKVGPIEYLVVHFLGRLLSITSDNKASSVDWSRESLITQMLSGSKGCTNPEKADKPAGESSTWKGDDEK